MDPESPSPAEQLPALYRAILDRVADLERRGQRRVAAAIRAEATRVYSRSWDEGARRRLEALLHRAEGRDPGASSVRAGLLRRTAPTA
jgi:hypothetical protein